MRSLVGWITLQRITFARTFDMTQRDAQGQYASDMDNHPFVARQIVAGLLGLLLYALLTRGLLWLARKRDTELAFQPVTVTGE